MVTLYIKVVYILLYYHPELGMTTNKKRTYLRFDILFDRRRESSARTSVVIVLLVHSTLRGFSSFVVVR